MHKYANYDVTVYNFQQMKTTFMYFSWDIYSLV